MISIGSTSSDRRELNKNFTRLKNINCTVKEPCSILNPVFVIKYDGGISSWNYLLCEQFGRYYFIDDINLLPGGRAELICSVDVLMSFNNAINNLLVNVSRNYNDTTRNPYISDSYKPLLTTTVTDTYVFNGHPFVYESIAGNYILTVMGGNRSGS